MTKGHYLLKTRIYDILGSMREAHKSYNRKRYVELELKAKSLNLLLQQRFSDTVKSVS